MQLDFEPAEGALAPDRPRQSPPGSLVADLIGEVGHVLVPDGGRQRINADQVELVEAGGGLAVDPGAGRPENDFSGLRVDQPPVLVVGLVRQRGGDLFEVKVAQIQHRASVIPAPGAVARQKRPCQSYGLSDILSAVLSACPDVDHRARSGTRGQVRS